VKKEVILTARERLILFCFNCLPPKSGLKLEEIAIKLNKLEKESDLSYEELEVLVNKKFLYYTIDTKFKRVYFKVR